jgi:hypothetical protein
MSKNRDKNLPVPSPGPRSELLFYQTEGGTRLAVRLEGQTVWLTQGQMAELFQTTVPNISMHIRNIFTEGELQPDSVVKNYLTTAADGKSYNVAHYNLDMIIAVGYRVRSHRGTQFRQWATQRLREYIVKGFVLDDQRLMEPRGLGADYFDELLERIRAIRASERRFYQKITDIYATSIDYDPNAEITRTFYATVQNKLHWAIHGHTAAEIIVERADAAKPNMGLTTWRKAPRGPVRKDDVTVAKNYLGEQELSALNRVVTMYLDYAETQAEGRRPMHMADWVARLDAFLQFNERNILTHAGKVSHELAEQHAMAEFDKYESRRRELEAAQPTSDFDKAVEQVKQLTRQQPGLPGQTSPAKPSKRPRKRRGKAKGK